VILQQNVLILLKFGTLTQQNVFVPFASNKLFSLSCLRQQTLFVSANEKALSHGAGLTKQIYKQFPKGTVICTSSYKYIVNFTSAFVMILQVH